MDGSLMNSQVYVALLRGINVSGHNPLAMKDLRTLVEATGAERVETYLQSGNVVFRSSATEADRVRGAIEARIRATGLGIVVVVRTAENLQEVVAANPLLGQDRDRSKLHVSFLAAPPDSDRASVLRSAAESGTAAGTAGEFRLGPREVYLYCPDGYGRTKLNNAFFERKLAVAATTRNWRTVTTLAEMSKR